MAGEWGRSSRTLKETTMARAYKRQSLARRLFSEITARLSALPRVRRRGRRRGPAVLITSVYAMPESVKGRIDTVHR